MISRIIEENYMLLNEEREKNNFWVTDASKCARQIYYSFKEKPTNPPSVEAVLRWEFGKAAETTINSLLEKAGVLCDTQVRVDIPVTDSYALHGAVDQIIGHDEIKHICECKTFFGYDQEKDLKNNKPNRGYVLQLGMYIFFLQDVIKDLSNVGFLYYLSREYMNMYEFTVEVKGKDICCNDKVYGNVDEILDKFKNIISKLEGNTPPAPDFIYKYSLSKFIEIATSWSDNKKKTAITNLNHAIKGDFAKVYGDWQCKYCPYKDLCLSSLGINLGYTPQEASVFKETLKAIPPQGIKKNEQHELLREVYNVAN